MYVGSDLLKRIILCWGKVSTIVPPNQKKYIDNYISGKITGEIHYPLEEYKKIYDEFGEEVVDFVVISDDERKRASEKMFDLLTTWNKDTHYYDSLRIKSISDFIGKTVTWYWFFHEKLEHELVELLLEEQLVVNWDPYHDEIVGFEEVGKSYMSIIAEELKQSRNTRLITDDEFFLAAKSGIGRSKLNNEEADQGYELVSLAIPQVYFDDSVLEKLKWKDIHNIRKELLPYAENYYTEVEQYQERINSLTIRGKEDEAFDVLCEFCQRVAMSFRAFAKETGKILRLGAEPKTLGILNGIILPTVRLFNPSPELIKMCDVLAISSTLGYYSIPQNRPITGFEYLENLNRKLSIEKLKQTVSCIVPKSLKEFNS